MLKYICSLLILCVVIGAAFDLSANGRWGGKWRGEHHKGPKSLAFVWSTITHPFGSVLPGGITQQEDGTYKTSMVVGDVSVNAVFPLLPTIKDVSDNMVRYEATTGRDGSKGRSSWGHHRGDRVGYSLIIVSDRVKAGLPEDPEQAGKQLVKRFQELGSQFKITEVAAPEMIPHDSTYGQFDRTVAFDIGSHGRSIQAVERVIMVKDNPGIVIALVSGANVFEKAKTFLDSVTITLAEAEPVGDVSTQIEEPVDVLQLRLLEVPDLVDEQ